MIATIVSRHTRKACCGLAGSVDVFQLDDPRVGEIEVSTLPSAKVGDQIELDYIQIDNGWRWWPVQIVKEAA